MKNAAKALRQAYYDALNGNIDVNVYKEDVPSSEVSNHVIIRVESETDESNNQQFVTLPVVIIEIVTIFGSSIDPDKVEDIDNTIRGILPAHFSFTMTDFQHAGGTPQSSTYISEDDGVNKYFRKITRYTNRVIEKT